jgi:hypothetical protein
VGPFCCSVRTSPAVSSKLKLGHPFKNNNPNSNIACSNMFIQIKIWIKVFSTKLPKRTNGPRPTHFGMTFKSSLGRLGQLRASAQPVSVCLLAHLAVKEATFSCIFRFPFSLPMFSCLTIGDNPPRRPPFPVFLAPPATTPPSPLIGRRLARRPQQPAHWSLSRPIPPPAGDAQPPNGPPLPSGAQPPSCSDASKRGRLGSDAGELGPRLVAAADIS